MSRRGWLGVLALTFSFGTALADEFDRIEGDGLRSLIQSNDVSAHAALSFGDLEALPNVLRDTRSAFLLARTDEGNFARLLVSPAFRKTSGAPLPVLAVERFDTFDSGNIASRVARGKDLILFDGFQLDLDTGQIVPDGHGGDLQFVAQGGPRLVALGRTRLFSVSKVPVSASKSARHPSIGRAVIPTDFAGRYRLYANGQWSGTLDLNVDQAGAVTGRFRSDLNGSSYGVRGEVAADVPQKVRFRIEYPRTHQDFEGLIWTEGKGALAGTLTMIDRSYGFFAIREAGRFAPDGEDVAPLAKGAERPGRRTVAVRKGEYTLDGKPKTEQELADAVKQAVTTDPTTWVLLQVPNDEPYSAINRAFEILSAAGVASIRLAPAD